LIYFTASAKKYTASLSSPWGDLLDDPKKWWDFRDSKHNGSVMIDDLGYIFLFDYYILGDFFIFVST